MAAHIRKATKDEARAHRERQADINLREEYKKALEAVSESMQEQMDEAIIELLTTGSAITDPSKTAEEYGRGNLTTTGDPEAEKEARKVLDMAKNASDMTVALLEDRDRPLLGPDQAWRDFTKVSTIYQAPGTEDWPVPNWKYSDPNAEKAPEANPHATWKHQYRNASPGEPLLPREEAEQLGRDYDKAKYQQSKLESLVEALVNTATGFLLSWAVWLFIAAPLFGIPIHLGESFLLTCLFTITSVARSYVWRRFFNASIHKKIHAWCKP